MKSRQEQRSLLAFPSVSVSLRHNNCCCYPLSLVKNKKNPKKTLHSRCEKCVFLSLLIDSGHFGFTSTIQNKTSSSGLGSSCLWLLSREQLPSQHASCVWVFSFYIFLERNSSNNDQLFDNDGYVHLLCIIKSWQEKLCFVIQKKKQKLFTNCVTMVSLSVEASKNCWIY